MRTTCLTIVALLILGGTPAAQRLFVDARKRPMPLAMAETVALYPAELSGDGRLDVVVANRGGGLWYPANGSWVLLGAGDGRLRNVTPPSYENARLALAVADLDGDGDRDVLFLNEVTGTGGIGLNDGAGAMSWTEDLFPAPFARVAVAADLDADGDADVCTGTQLFENRGALLFADVSATHLPPLALTAPPVLALGDVDGDGDPDLLLGDPAGQDRLLRNDGSAHFADVTATHLPLASDATSGLALADLDADGDLDVARARLGLRLEGYRNDGSGRMTVWVFSGISREATAVAAGDLDGDGHLDLVYGLASGGLLLRGDGTRFTVESGRWEPGAEPTCAVVLSDVDGDGDLDLMQGSGQPSTAQPDGLENRTFFNDGTGRFATVPLSPLPAAFAERRVAGGDFDGDGDLDLLYAGAPACLLRNDGFGAFSAQALALPVAGVPVAGDLDGDGDLDAVLVDVRGAFHVLVNPGDGELWPRVTQWLPPLPPLATLEAGALGDLDGDGDLDLLLVTTGVLGGRVSPLTPDALWLNDGSGAFSDASYRLPASGSSATDVALGDLDNDGDLDAVTTGGVVYVNEGATFRGTSFAIEGNYGESHIALADLDGDGFLDVAAGNACRGLGCAPSLAGGPDAVHWNDGGGGFGPGQLLETQSSMATSVVTGDVDGDGDIDVLIGHVGQAGIGHDNPAENTLFVNEGARVFRRARPDEFPLDFDQTQALVLGDVDADGDADLVVCNRALEGGAFRGKVHANATRHLFAPYHARTGRPYPLELHGAHRGGGLWLAAAPARIPLPPLGVLGLDPATTLFLGALGPGAGGVVLRIPAAPALVGLDLWFQALVFGADARPRLTNRIVDPVTAL